MEDPDFIRSVLKGSPAARWKPADQEAPARERRQPKARVIEPVRILRKTSELSEDLL